MSGQKKKVKISKQMLTSTVTDEQNMGSNHSAELKYKKAVRQISKLMNLTNTIRKGKVILEEALAESQKDNERLRKQLKEIHTSEGIRIANHLQLSYLQADRSLNDTNSIKDGKSKILELQQILHHKQRLIQEFQGQVQDNHAKQKYLTHKCQRLQQQLDLVNEHNREEYEEQDHTQPKKVELHKSHQNARLSNNQYSPTKTENENEGHNFFMNIQNINSDSIDATVPKPSVHQSQSKGQKNKSEVVESMMMETKTQQYHSNHTSHQTSNNIDVAIASQLQKKCKLYKQQLETAKKSNIYYIQKYEKLMGYIEMQQKFIQNCVLKSQCAPVSQSKRISSTTD